MRLKPLLFIAGAAGVIAAVAKRGPKAVQSVAGVAPEPVKQAASTAAETVQRAVDTVTPGGEQATTVHERYEPPAEAGAQPPTEPGGPPSSQATAIHAEPVVSDPSEQLNLPEHAPPEGSVVPDTSDDDPLVREEEKAAAGDAGSIGGNVNAMAAEDESFPRDPAERPVAEGAGDEEEEVFETREDIERGNREMEP